MTITGNKIIEYMKAQKYRILSLNIVYLEGVNQDFTLNDDKADYWNDLRLIVKDTGKVEYTARATTEPGRFYTHNPMNPKGAFRIAFGNYQDCWTIGRHYNQDALVQCGPLRGYRDLNKDGKRIGDKIDVGSHFGVNQHTTGGVVDTIGRWSAGCLVGQNPVEHKLFMQWCRWMGKRTFDSTIIDGGLLYKL